MAASRTREPHEQTSPREALAALSRRLPPDDYFSRFLQHLAGIIPYRVARVWGLNQQGVLENVAQRIGERDFAAPAGALRGSVHQALQVLSQGKPAASPAPSGAESLTSLFVPLVCHQRPIGVLEVLVPKTADTLEAAQLSTLEEIARHANAYLGANTGEASPAPDDDISQVSLRLHQSLNLEKTALAIANEGQRVLAADRVSVAVHRGGTVEVAAVSGRERIARRADVTKAIRSLAELVVASGRGCSFLGQALDDSPLDVAIAKLAERTGAIRVIASPLVVKSNEGSQTDASCGVLLTEHFSDSSPAVDSATAEAFERHAAVALTNAIRHEDQLGALPNRLLSKLYNALNRAYLRRRRNHILIALAALLALGFLPTPYKVSATGRLLPAVRSSLFAPSDARVTAVLVEGGQQVKRGDVLVRLANDQLAANINSLASRLEEQRQAIAMLQAELDDQGAREGPAAARLQGRIAQAQTEVQGLRTRLKALREEQGRLELRAAHDGTVATFQPEQLLRDRPVRRGEVLLEVMDFQSPWTLLLDCPAANSAHVTAACTASDEHSQPVEFVLATHPEVTHQAVVERLANHTSQGPDGRAVVEVLASVTPESAPAPDAALAGGEVLARIDCGRKPLAYVLFGGVYEYARRIMW